MALHALRHPLEGQTMLNGPDGVGEAWLDALNGALGRRADVVDVLLPARCPFRSLVGQALVGARVYEVEGGEAAQGSCSVADGFARLDNSQFNGHGGGFPVGVKKCFRWKKNTRDG